MTNHNWYAILTSPDAPSRPARGPFRSESEITAALGRWIARAGYINDLYACNPQVYGPYATKAAAAAATLTDDVPSRPLLPPRKGYGGWPKGRPRNEIRPPEGWESIDALLAEVEKWCQTHRAGRKLARALGVSPASLHRWLSGKDYPPTSIVDRLISEYSRMKEKP